MTAVTSSPRGEAQPITRGFLFADLRGYTAYVEARGDAAGASLLDVYRELMRETIGGHGGAEIKTEGDSFYVVFPSASTAVACGLAIVAAASIRTAADPERPIRVGVGIHAGESVEGAEGYVGSAVNIAARVCAQSAAGEVLVTETVRSLTRTSGRLAFTSRGRRRLKGIAEPIALYRVDPAGTPMAGSTSGAFRRVDRRLVVALAGAGLVFMAIVAAASLGFGRTPPTSPSGTAGAALPSPSPVLVERIAYTSIRSSDRLQAPTCDTFGGEARLWLVDPNGEERVRLLPPGDVWETQAAWSPNGSMVAFVAIDQRGLASLHVVESDGSDGHDLLPPTPPDDIDPDAARWRRPSWSPDSARLVFTYGNGGVWVVGADGSDLHRLIAPFPAPPEPTPDAQGNVEPEFAPEFGLASWMPDGRIAVEVTEPTKDPDSPALTTIYAAAADGSGLALLAGLPTNVSITQPAWAADGRMAFLAGIPSTDGPTVNELHVLDPGADTPRKLPLPAGTAAGPGWSPDGKRIVFGSGDLHIVNSDGSGMTEIPAETGRAACWPTWGRPTIDDLPRPTPTLAPGAPAPVLAFHIGELEPGTYETSVFRPKIRFIVGPGWEGRRNNVDDFAMGPLSGGELDAGLIQVVVDGPCLDSPTKTLGPSPRDFVSALEANAFLAVSDPFPVNLAGRSGLRVDVDVAKMPTEKDCTFLSPRVPLFLVGGGLYSLREEEHIRVVALDVGGQTVTFFFNREPESFLQQTQSVIDTITFP